MTEPRAAAPATAAANDGNEDGNRWVTARIGPSGFRTHLQARAHTVVADEPTTFGGTDSGPTPYELLLGALGGCMAMTLRMYADRKGWPLDAVQVQLRSAPSHEPDCEQCEDAEVGLKRIERRVELTGALTEEQHRRLMQIADRCPVKQTLERGMRVVDPA